jgi:hypothetical protein
MSPARELVSGGRNPDSISATDGRREAARPAGRRSPPLCGGDINRFLEPEQSGGSAGPGSRLDV